MDGTIRFAEVQTVFRMYSCHIYAKWAFLDESVASSFKDVECEDCDAALEEATIARTCLRKFCRLLQKH